jgi:hypothetical protein
MGHRDRGARPVAAHCIPMRPFLPAGPGGAVMLRLPGIDLARTFGTRLVPAKLTEKDVHYIRQLIYEGFGANEIADHLGVSGANALVSSLCSQRPGHTRPAYLWRGNVRRLLRVSRVGSPQRAVSGGVVHYQGEQIFLIFRCRRITI